jgi:hypothetical protein
VEKINGNDNIRPSGQPTENGTMMSDNIRPSGQPTENGTMMKIKCTALM